MADFVINRGTSFGIDVVYKKNGVAASLVGATIWFTMKKREYTEDTDDSDASVQKIVTSHTNAPAGLSNVTILPADTQDLHPGDYCYDIKVKEAGGTIYKLTEGTLTLDGSPTNRIV